MIEMKQTEQGQRERERNENVSIKNYHTCTQKSRTKRIPHAIMHWARRNTIHLHDTSIHSHDFSLSHAQTFPYKHIRHTHTLQTEKNGFLPG